MQSTLKTVEAPYGSLPGAGGSDHGAASSSWAERRNSNASLPKEAPIWTPYRKAVRGHVHREAGGGTAAEVEEGSESEMSPHTFYIEASRSSPIMSRVPSGSGGSARVGLRMMS